MVALLSRMTGGLMAAPQNPWDRPGAIPHRLAGPGYIGHHLRADGRSQGEPVKANHIYVQHRAIFAATTVRPEASDWESRARAQGWQPARPSESGRNNNGRQNRHLRRKG